MSQQNLTDITLVLDRSGSMEDVREATISAFNQFLHSQKQAEGEANLTLVQFDDEFDLLYEARTIHESPELNATSYIPRGVTALLDAIGQTIVRTGQRLAAMPQANRPGSVLFVTLTDGYENASEEYDLKQINQMIARQQTKYSWQFLFLAANQDAIATASQMGINAAQALTFEADDEGVAATMDIMEKKITKSRKDLAKGMQCAPISFDTEDRKAAMGKGAKTRQSNSKH